MFDDESYKESVRNKKELSFEMVENYKKELSMDHTGLSNC